MIQGVVTIVNTCHVFLCDVTLLQESYGKHGAVLWCVVTLNSVTVALRNKNGNHTTLVNNIPIRDDLFQSIAMAKK